MPHTEELVIKATVASLKAVHLADKIPFDCTVIAVTRHWPSGCNALVDVAVGFGDQQHLPREDFVALDDATISAELIIRVKRGTDFWVLIRNTDAANAHTITVMTLIREENGAGPTQ